MWRRGGRAAAVKRVAYLNGRTYRGAPVAPGEVPELERVSRRMIAAAGAEQGIQFDVRYWDDASIAEGGYDAAIIRTCWDYHHHLEEFISALTALRRSGLPVYNSPDIVRWNSRKTYLKELGSAAIETIWAEQADAPTIARAFDALDAAEIVVKPQVGAGSRETVRLKRNAWSEADLIEAPRDAAMIQPFLTAIETEGERSLFWFDGTYSHAIQKIPKSGDWLANIPGRTHFRTDPPPKTAMEVADAARTHAPTDLLYVRIDLVLGDDGRWRVIEIEAIEPYLFLDFAPEGAVNFVRAVSRVLAG
jgi:glutathione synthase/RimK-type ligase-like ATP-grasp enzyme